MVDRLCPSTHPSIHPLLVVLNVRMYISPLEDFRRRWGFIGKATCYFSYSIPFVSTPIAMCQTFPGWRNFGNWGGEPREEGRKVRLFVNARCRRNQNPFLIRCAGMFDVARRWGSFEIREEGRCDAEEKIEIFLHHPATPTTPIEVQSRVGWNRGSRANINS